MSNHDDWILREIKKLRESGVAILINWVSCENNVCSSVVIRVKKKCTPNTSEVFKIESTTGNEFIVTGFDTKEKNLSLIPQKHVRLNE